MNSSQYTVRLEPEYLTVIPLTSRERSSAGLKIAYLESPPVRDAARALLDTLAERCSSELFSDLCVQCGNCCTDRVVNVTSKTIEQIAHYLGFYDDRLFRDEHLADGYTWNAQDGILAKRDGACIFLERTGPHLSRCRVYPVRPPQCLSVSPAGDRCLKDRGVLIDHMDELCIFSETIEIKRPGGRIYSFPADDPALSPVIANLLVSLEPDLSSGINDLICRADEASGMVIAAESLFYESGLTKELEEKIEGAIDAVEAIREVEGISGPGLSVRMDSLSDAIQHLLRCIDDETHSSEPETGRPRFVLFPEYLELKEHQAGAGAESMLHYRDHPEILRLVRELLISVAGRADHKMLGFPADEDIECVHCGECCSNHTGEVGTDEIEKIASHLGLSLEKMWNDFLEPGSCSWNRHRAVFRKTRANRCPFMEVRAGSTSFCSIYDVRPLSCRSTAGLISKCIRGMSSVRPELCTDRIVSIEVRKRALLIRTTLSESLGDKPGVLFQDECGKLRDLVDELRREAGRIICLNIAGHPDQAESREDHGNTF
jgi:Fe-S-cluster containining protein